MNKQDLIKAFPAISPVAIQERDGEYVIVGKFCIVAPLGGDQWDLWLCNPKDLAQGLTTRKLRILLEKLRLNAAFTVLDGEAYANLQGTALIENNLDLLGIRKKRQLSEEHRQKLRLQMKALKNAA